MSETISNSNHEQINTGLQDAVSGAFLKLGYSDEFNKSPEEKQKLLDDRKYPRPVKSALCDEETQLFTLPVGEKELRISVFAKSTHEDGTKGASIAWAAIFKMPDGSLVNWSGGPYDPDANYGAQYNHDSTWYELAEGLYKIAGQKELDDENRTIHKQYVRAFNDMEEKIKKL